MSSSNPQLNATLSDEHNESHGSGKWINDEQEIDEGLTIPGNRSSMAEARAGSLDVPGLGPGGSSKKVWNRPLPSSKNPHFQNGARCTTFFSENEFYLRGNEKWFPYQRLNTYPRFETEARGNSEIAYKRFIHRHRVNRSVATNSSWWFLETWSILTEDLSQILSMVFFSKNMQYVWAFTPRYSNNSTKCYCKQCIAR